MSGRTYLLEAYVSKSVADGPSGIAGRAVSAADEMRREGTAVRYLRSIFVPQDETCFHIFEASCEADVRDAAARAGIHAERVLETTTLEAPDRVPRVRDHVRKEKR
jgi:hypothetical protein